MNNSRDYQGFREEFEQIGHSLLPSPAAQTNNATWYRVMCGQVWERQRRVPMHTRVRMHTRVPPCLLCRVLERVSGQSEPTAKRGFLPCGTTVDSLGLAECKNSFPLFNNKGRVKKNESQRQVINLADRQCPAVVCEYSHS